MAGQTLTAREEHTLLHLRRAEELGTSLQYYATSFELDLQQLNHTKAQLERKGLWPIKRSAPTPTLEETRTGLLAVQVLSQKSVPEATPETPKVPEHEALRVRLIAPNGWILESDRWPAAQWLTALMGGGA